MRVAAVQVTYDGDEDVPREERIARVATQTAAALAREAPEGVDLVVLPELWAVGAFRPRRWRERAEGLDGPTVTAMAGLGHATGAVVHVGAIVERAGDSLYNTGVLLGPDGQILATYRKIHRFAAGGMEAELLDGGDRICVVDVPLRDGSSVRTGLSTCYDLRFPELYRAQVDAGAEMFVVPASWPTRRIDAWELLLRARAAENQCLVVGVNAVGLDGRMQMGGHSAVVDPLGRVIAAAGASERVLVVDLDPAAPGEARSAMPLLADRRIRIADRPGS